MATYPRDGALKEGQNSVSATGRITTYFDRTGPIYGCPRSCKVFLLYGMFRDCGHLSGLSWRCAPHRRPRWLIRKPVPNHAPRARSSMRPTGLAGPGPPGHAISFRKSLASAAACQSRSANPFLLSFHTAWRMGAPYTPPNLIIAQITRAVLLATATVATFAGRLARSFASHTQLLLRQRMIERLPWIKRRRR